MTEATQNAVIVVPNLVLTAALEEVDGRVGLGIVNGLLGSTLQRLSTGAGEVGGLYMRRSVAELLWELDDPLLRSAALILPGLQDFIPFQLIKNCTGTESARDNGRTAVRTGKDNINEAQVVVESDGEREVTCWDAPVEVGGHSGAQFPTNLKFGTPLEMWGGPLRRKIPLAPVGEPVYLHDVKLYRY